MMMKKHTHNSSLKQKQRGIAMVEFVIAAPVVLFVALAVTEIGHALLQYNSLTQSLRDGARQLANTAAKGSTRTVDPSAAELIEVGNLIAYGSKTAGTPLLPGLTAGNVTVSQLGDQMLSIRVDYPYQPLLVGDIPIFFQSGSVSTNFTLSAEMVVRAL
jgi:Flp pilus assembly protein TadG